MPCSSYLLRKHEAHEARAEKKQAEKARVQKEAEDAYWHDDGDKNMQKKAERVKLEEEKKMA